MDNADIKERAAGFEESVRKNLVDYLQGKGVIDAHVPECPDVEEKWAEIARSYIADGAREFAGYPVVSLGWMMFLGMAMAYYWDTDWEKHHDRKDIYEELRDRRGYDNMDEVIIGDVLRYEGDDAEKVSDLVASCAARVHSLMQHSHVEPGTSEAYGYYIAALHQLYLAGMAVELNALGYHMTPLQTN